MVVDAVQLPVAEPGEAVGWGHMDVGTGQLPVAEHLDNVADVLYRCVFIAN